MDGWVHTAYAQQVNFGVGALDRLAELSGAWRPLAAQTDGQVGIVLVGDQHLGDVSLGGVAQRHPVVGQRPLEPRESGHVGIAPYSVAP
jgi:hypothetical protein